MEIWEDIKDYEGLYQISNLGNVKSLDRIVKNMKFNGKILKTMQLKNKYFIIDLRKGGLKTRKNFFIHRLVAQAFLGLDINNSKICVCHKDDNPANNNVENLFLGTHKDNTQDMINKGRDNRIGRINGKYISNVRKFLLQEKENILNLYKKGFSYRKIANIYNVSHNIIGNIIKNR